VAESGFIAGHFHGGCQCGAVRYAADKRLDNAHICHCRMCQKAVGGFFAALVGLPDEAMVWTRGSPAVFKSSDQAERGFCSNCGTPLYYRWSGGGHTSVTIASLDDPSAVAPRMQYGNEGLVPYFDSLHMLEGRDTTTENSMTDDAIRVRASNHQHPDQDTRDWIPRLTER
jgi:hypothetical protein